MTTSAFTWHPFLPFAQSTEAVTPFTPSALKSGSGRVISLDHSSPPKKCKSGRRKKEKETQNEKDQEAGRKERRQTKRKRPEYERDTDDEAEEDNEKNEDKADNELEDEKEGGEKTRPKLELYTPSNRSNTTLLNIQPSHNT